MTNKKSRTRFLMSVCCH